MSIISEPWPLPEWLPDETFFSLASRYHEMTGRRLPEHTSLALFGRRRWGFQHDFPNPLAAFVEKTSGRMGTARALAETRTILPYYLVHRKPILADQAYQALSDPNSGMLKFRLGIVTSRFRANHPLKACLECMRDDEQEHGVGYWHRRHQFPGVWVCPMHETLLLTSTVKFNGVQRFSWLTPSIQVLQKINTDPLPPSAKKSLLKLTRMAVAWGESAEASLDQEQLAQLYRQRVRAISANRNRIELADHYVNHIASLRGIPELSGLPSAQHQALASINRWIFRPNGAAHPLRNLSLIFWLFNEWHTFIEAYQSSNTGGDVADQTRAKRPQAAHDQRRAEVLKRIDQGQAVSSIARDLGLAVQTAITWAAAAGISSSRRPKVLREGIYASLVQALSKGTDKELAARSHGVSVVTVTRVLRSEVGLSQRWHEARFQRAQVGARQTWQEAIQSLGDFGMKAVRESEAATYAWLYRNDRDWLQSQAGLITSARTNNSAVRWDQRDAVLASEVKRIADTLKPASKDGAIRLWQLFQALPDLKAKLGALRYLPLTRQAIKTATRRPRHSLGTSKLL